MNRDKAHDLSLLVEAARAQARGRGADARRLVDMVSERSRPLAEKLIDPEKRDDSTLELRFLRELAGVGEGIQAMVKCKEDK